MAPRVLVVGFGVNIMVVLMTVWLCGGSIWLRHVIVVFGEISSMTSIGRRLLDVFVLLLVLRINRLSYVLRLDRSTGRRTLVSALPGGSGLGRRLPAGLGH